MFSSPNDFLFLRFHIKWKLKQIDDDNALALDLLTSVPSDLPPLALLSTTTDGSEGENDVANILLNIGNQKITPI